MKVAINACYGGFSLSPKATKRLAELQGRKCYFFKYQDQPEINFHIHVPISMSEAQKQFSWSAYDIPNPDEVLPSQEKWSEWTNEERAASNDAWDKHHLETGRSIDRTDPKLIQVIEELGKRANGAFSELKIVKIPNGVDYEIDEYDGLESIH